MTQITLEPSNIKIYFHRKNRCIFFKRDVLKGLEATVKNERLKLSINVQKKQKEYIFVLSFLDQFCSFLLLKKTHAPTAE